MDKTIGICTFEKYENRMTNSCGSSRIRGKWIWHNWAEAEEYQIGKKYDVMIFQKAYWELMAQEFKGIKIFDLCDPDFLDNRPVFEMISYCDAVTTSTQVLADYIKKLTNKPVLCIPDRVDLKEVKQTKTEHKGVARNVVWFGYSNNLKYIERTFDYLASKKLFFTYLSDESLMLPNDKGLESRFIKYRQEIINQEVIKHDFVIMPETVDLDGRLKYKSNNKTIQSWAWGMPVAFTPQDIDRFLIPDEREKESKLRLQEVKDKWDVKFSVEEFKQLISSLKKA